MSGPGPVIAVAAYAAFLLLAAVTAAGVGLAVDAVLRTVRGRRSSRMMRTAVARRIQRDAALHVDHFAAHDPEVQDGFARLDAALHGKQRREAS